MASIQIVDKTNKKVGDLDLPKSAEGKSNKAVLYQAVRASRSAKHHGTVDTKTRAEVNRTNKKVYRQKGTGGARHGSRKTSPFVGGGRVFGPHQRNHTIRLSRKVRQLAYAEAIKECISGGSLVLVNEIPLKTIKTKEAKSFFNGLNVSEALVVIDQASDVIQKSIRNLKHFKSVLVDQLDVVDILNYKNVVVTQKAFEKISQKYFN